VSRAYALKKYLCVPLGGQGPPYDCLLELFIPSVPGTLFSSILFFVGGMFQTIQWSHVPIGASGSSTIKVRLCVPSGMPSIFRGGLTSSPSHVYFDGMKPLFWKAELVIMSFSTATRLCS